jgi:hypothetical protein
VLDVHAGPPLKKKKTSMTAAARQRVRGTSAATGAALPEPATQLTGGDFTGQETGHEGELRLMLSFTQLVCLNLAVSCAIPQR